MKYGVYVDCGHKFYSLKSMLRAVDIVCLLDIEYWMATLKHEGMGRQRMENEEGEFQCKDVPMEHGNGKGGI